MSYKTYTTEAFVCGSYSHNTSDKNYLLFARDAGMVFATARSVREEKSKQRYALQDFSRIRVSLVKGKHGWRIGSAEALGNAFLGAETRDMRILVNHVFVQLRRYVHGEVAVPSVYDDVDEMVSSAALCTQYGKRTEQVFALRLLYVLGYIALEDAWSPIVHAKTLNEALSLYTEGMEVAIVRAVTKGAEASHL